MECNCGVYYGEKSDCGGVFLAKGLKGKILRRDNYSSRQHVSKEGHFRVFVNFKSLGKDACRRHWINHYHFVTSERIG